MLQSRTTRSMLRHVAVYLEVTDTALTPPLTLGQLTPTPRGFAATATATNVPVSRYRIDYATIYNAYRTVSTLDRLSWRWRWTLSTCDWHFRRKGFPHCRVNWLVRLATRHDGRRRDNTVMYVHCLRARLSLTASLMGAREPAAAAGARQNYRRLAAVTRSSIAVASPRR